MSNNVDNVINLVSENSLKFYLKQPFFCRFDLDEKNEPIIQDWSNKTKAYRIAFTSIALLSKYGLALEDWVNDLESDIDYLNSSMSIDEFENRKCYVLEKWTSKGWTLWLRYFNKEWFTEARFNSWKMFHVLKGFSNANNPIESFDKIVK